MEVCEPKSIPTIFSRNQIRDAQESSHGMLHSTSCSNELPPQTLIYSFSAPAPTRGTGQIQHPAMNSAISGAQGHCWANIPVFNCVLDAYKAQLQVLGGQSRLAAVQHIHYCQGGW